MTEIIIALIAAVAGGGGTALVGALASRKREKAQADQLAAAANAAVFESYRTLIEDLRHDAALAREEARGARAEAREAQARATEAETRAAGAENRATSAERQLTEMRRLVEQHVPDADELLRRFEQLSTVKARNMVQ